MGFLQTKHLYALGLLCSMLAFSPQLCRSQQQQHIDPDPFAAIRQVAKPAASIGAGYVYSDAQKVAAQLVRPLSLDAATASAVASYLANRQTDWQSHLSDGINEAKLVQNLNAALQLTDAPEYLKLRQDQLHRIRVFLSVKLPDLNGGIDKRTLAKGQSVVNSTMSPFEAYAAAGLLLFQKLNNKTFLRTPAEEAAARAKPTESLSPGIHVTSVSTRGIEFQDHLAQLSKNGTLAPESVLQLMQTVMEESRQ